MFPAAVGFDAVFAAIAFRSIGSSPVESVLASVVALVAADLRRPLAVAVGASLLTIVGGVVLIVWRPSTTRTIRDDAVARPDLTFATGFLVLFAPLVVVTIPLFASTYVAHPAVIAVVALVALPAALLSGAVAIVGGCFGAIVVGDRLAGSVGGDSPSLWRALALGTTVLGASLVVPILGTVVAIALAIIGIGGVARRRFDPWNDGGRDGDADERDRPIPDAATARTSGGGWNATDSSWDDRTRRDGVRESDLDVDRGADEICESDEIR